MSAVGLLQSDPKFGRNLGWFGAPEPMLGEGPLFDCLIALIFCPPCKEAHSRLHHILYNKSFKQIHLKTNCRSVCVYVRIYVCVCTDSHSFETLWSLPQTFAGLEALLLTHGLRPVHGGE